jgi:pimeloyl-ACP methyl ester carboxylesterase
VNFIEQWIVTRDNYYLYVRVKKAQKPTKTLVFLHGVFSDSRFFLSSKGSGPAEFFIDENTNIVLFDFRDHGKSHNKDSKRLYQWSFDTLINQDIPAVIHFCQQEFSCPIDFVAHSFGGYVLLASIATHHELQRYCNKISLIGTAINDFSDGPFSKRLQFYFAHYLSMVLGYFPASTLKIGPSNASKQLMKQFLVWAKSRTFCSLDHSIDYWELLQRVDVPVLSLIGQNDMYHATPKRAKFLFDKLKNQTNRFVVCGRENGFLRDYSHFDIVNSKQAYSEILPLVKNWNASEL